MFFDLNNDSYQILDDAQDVDIYLTAQMDGGGVPAKVYIGLDVFHNLENQITDQWYPDNYYYITNAVNKKSYVSGQVRSVDFLFNRTKAYHLNFKFSADTDKWYHAGHNAYPTMTVPKAQDKEFIFLSPNNTHQGQRFYRTKLVNFLIKNHSATGLISYVDQDPFSILKPHCEFAHVPDHSTELFSIWPVYTIKPGGYTPVHNSYYYHSFVSIYGETIESGHTLAVTEKTYEPLIRGHFILPFSTAGFVQHLQSLGFVFPEFIDYSYDSIEDPDLRYQAYQTEIHRLLCVNRSVWCRWWDQNLELLVHNQQLFVQKPYDRIDLRQLIQSTKT